MPKVRSQKQQTKARRGTTELKTVEVYHCSECPFMYTSVTDTVDNYCIDEEVEERLIEGIDEDREVPAWCPLRSGPRLVQLKLP
jgi:hypothetical protein